MKALYLTLKPIHPTVDGGCVAMASFLNHLLKIYSRVDNLTIETYKHPFNRNHYPQIENEKFSVNSIYVNTKIAAFDAFINLFSNLSYNVNRFYNQEFESKLIEYLNSDYQVIFIESIFLSPYIRTIKKYSKAKLILRAPNIEFKIWENHSQNTKNPIKKWYLHSLTEKLKKTELKCFNQVDGILTISNHDCSIIETFTPKTPKLNLPFSIESENITPINKNHFFFIGAYNWQPNLDAVLHIINSLFPLILKKFPDSILHIAGSYTPKELYQYESQSIKIHGKVSSVKEFMKQSGILLAPIFSGSGVRIKILEALSFGIPVIGSSIAVQGINSKACFIANKDNDYIDIIQSFNSDLINEIQKDAIDYINKNYHPTQIEKLLDEFVQNI